MAFSTDYSNVGLIAEGDYECVIAEAFSNSTKNGAEYFSVNFVIRDDVPQKYQKKHLFHSIWRKKEPTADDMKIGGFSFGQIMALSKAAQLPNGKAYETLDELGNDLEGRCVKVHVSHEFNEYYGEDRERVKWINKTEHPRENTAVQQTHQNPQPQPPQRQKQGSVSELADDDLPW